MGSYQGQRVVSISNKQVYVCSRIYFLLSYGDYSRQT